jgi:FHA domain
MAALVLAAASDSLEVLLQFAFLAILFLFLIWVVNSALRDLRRPTAAAADGLAPFPGDERHSLRRAWLVSQGGGGLDAGDAYDVSAGLTIGRSTASTVQISDTFASGRHARIFLREGLPWLEDMRSTNGTYLNGERIEGEVGLQHGDVIRIGDTQFRFEE